jgi:hypothetical protein
MSGKVENPALLHKIRTLGRDKKWSDATCSYIYKELEDASKDSVESRLQELERDLSKAVRISMVERTSYSNTHTCTILKYAMTYICHIMLMSIIASSIIILGASVKQSREANMNVPPVCILRFLCDTQDYELESEIGKGAVVCHSIMIRVSSLLVSSHLYYHRLQIRNTMTMLSQRTTEN